MHSAKPHTIHQIHRGWTWPILLIFTLMVSVASVRAQSTATESVAEITEIRSPLRNLTAPSVPDSRSLKSRFTILKVENSMFSSRSAF